jgi:hypothetical protein
MRAMAKAGRLRDGKKGERIAPFAFCFSANGVLAPPKFQAEQHSA